MNSHHSFSRGNHDLRGRAKCDTGNEWLLNYLEGLSPHTYVGLMFVTAVVDRWDEIREEIVFQQRRFNVSIGSSHIRQSTEAGFRSWA